MALWEKLLNKRINFNCSKKWKFSTNRKLPRISQKIRHKSKYYYLFIILVTFLWQKSSQGTVMVPLRTNGLPGRFLASMASCLLKNWEYKLFYYLENERKSSHFKIIKKLILSFVKRIRMVFISIFEMIKWEFLLI